MTFAEVLPALARGRLTKWGIWTYRMAEGGNGMIESRNLSESEDAWQTVTPTRNFLLASDWELADEPDVANWCPCRSHDCPAVIARLNAWTARDAATIARLEREVASMREAVTMEVGLRVDLERNFEKQQIAAQALARKAITLMEDI